MYLKVFYGARQGQFKICIKFVFGRDVFKVLTKDVFLKQWLHADIVLEYISGNCA